jgi:23S rRNA (uracil1939-C5)-methyltransferase
LRVVLSGLAAIRREASVVVNLLDSGPDVLLRTDGELITGPCETHRFRTVS